MTNDRDYVEDDLDKKPRKSRSAKGDGGLYLDEIIAGTLPEGAEKKIAKKTSNPRSTDTKKFRKPRRELKTKKRRVAKPKSKLTRLKHIKLSKKLPKRTVYMHVIDGMPGYFDGKLIRPLSHNLASTYTNRTDYKMTLVDSLESLRKEQKVHLKTMIERGKTDIYEDLTYVPFYVEVYPILSRKERMNREIKYKKRFQTRLLNSGGEIPTWNELKSNHELLLGFLFQGMEDDAYRLAENVRAWQEANPGVNMNPSKAQYAAKTYYEVVRARLMRAGATTKEEVEGFLETEKRKIERRGGAKVKGSPDNILKLRPKRKYTKKKNVTGV